MSQRYQKRREIVLDIAEQMFAVSGYYAVSLRDIARESRLSLTDINDLFESKERLFYLVVERRATIINLMRIERLTQLNNRDTSIDALRPIMKAFFDPLYIKSRESEGWLNYLRLVLQIMRQRSPILLMVTEFYTPISDVFMKRIRQIFPSTPDDILAKYWHFALLTYFSIFLDDFHVGDFQLGLPGASSAIGDRQENFLRAEAFVLAGFKSLLIT